MSNDNGLIAPSPDIPIFSSTPYATRGPSITNTQISGIIPPNTTNYNNDGCYFIKKGEAIDGPLISPVEIFTSDLSNSAEIVVNSSPANYNGSITLITGENVNGPPMVGMTLRTSGENEATIEIGDNVQDNKLLIAGSSGLSQVFDGVYNPPTGVELINIIGPSPSDNYPNGWLTTSPNSGTIVSSFTGGTAGSFNVPKTGLYMLQATIMMAPETVSAGGSADGAFSLQITVNVASPPLNPVGGVVIGQPTPLSSEDTVSYYSWNSYIPLVAGELYNLTWRMLNGGGVYLPPNLINNLPYSDLKLQLIKIG
jgi:hypothetical protein